MTLFQLLSCALSFLFFCLALLCVWALFRGVKPVSESMNAVWFYAAVSLFLAWLGDVPLW